MTKPRPNSLTATNTASSADVARRSCSSAPLMPDVGISRASCQDSSAMNRTPLLLDTSVTRFRLNVLAPAEERA